MPLSEHLGAEHLPELFGGTLGIVGVGLISVVAIRNMFDSVFENNKR